MGIRVAMLLAATEPEVRAAMRQVYAAHRYQRDLPGIASGGSAAVEPPAGWAIPLDLGVLAPIIRAAFWAAVVVGVVFFLVWLARRLQRWPVSTDGDEDAEPGTQTRLTDAPLDDADALARDGQFAEAIHVLLLRTFEFLVRREGSRMVPAWTSREVLTRVSCPDGARAALADLVDAVELCWFAGARPQEKDYRRCADRFRVFSSAFNRIVA